MEIKPEIIQDAMKILGINVSEENTGNGLELCKQLSKLPFWCGDNELHIDNPDYRDNGCCLTHTVGLPKHPATKQEMPLTPYQVEFCNKIINDTKFTPKNKKNEAEEKIEFLRKPHLYHINKGRQMGFTEILLRLIQYFCFSRYAGSNIAIQAGTNGILANKDLRRFARLFLNIKPVVEQWIKSTKEGISVKIVNDTVIYAYPANEEAITGDTDYICIFEDENTKWKMIDDQPVFNGIMPIVRSNGADLFLVSTPKGPVKTFYHIHQDPQDFTKLKYDIWRTEGNLYTRKDIEDKLATSTEDPNQEYLCKFTTGRDSIFGTVSSEDKQGMSEWLTEEDELENDDYDKEGDKDEIMWHE